MELNDFIEEIGNAAIKYYPQYKILPSLCIAQALLESNKADYKKGLLKLSGLATECFNYYGMKWNSTCNCDRKAYKTKEWDGTKYVDVIAYFRKYPSSELGIKGYFDFLTYKRYKNLQNVTDYKKACELIRTDGWATSPTYTANLIERIEFLQLYKYDEKVGVVTTNGVTTKHPTLRRGQKDSMLGADYIRSWQTYLSMLGFTCHIDGIFGRETEDVVMQYQAFKKLKHIDGIIGPETWGTLPN